MLFKVRTAVDFEVIVEAIRKLIMDDNCII